MFLSVSLLEGLHNIENKIPFDAKFAEFIIIKSASNLCCNDTTLFLHYGDG